jgi:hypothetical protein
MNRKKRILIHILPITLVLLSCNLPFGFGGVNPTSVAQTVAMGISQTAAAQPTASPTQTVTETPTPTLTPTATVTQQEPTLTIGAAAAAPCNRAAFVTDVTYPDNSQITKDTGFVKTWRLQNTGTCTWTSGYKLVFSHGDRMSAPSEVTLTGGSVPAGATLDASVSLTSPSSEGTYTGNFKIKSPDGQIFGIGGDASGSFYVTIQVVVPAPGVTLIPLLPLQPIPMVPLLITAYTPSYRGGRSCFVSDYIHAIRIDNTGGRTLESWSVSLRDNTTSTLHDTYGGEAFGSSKDCISLALANIDAGGAGFISLKEKSDISGRSMTANIKVCTAAGLGGTCVDKTLTFNAD